MLDWLICLFDGHDLYSFDRPGYVTIFACARCKRYFWDIERIQAQ